MAIQDLRQNYTPKPLDPEHLRADPFEQFQAWFEDAKQHGILEPNAFTLATATADGQPNARTVLLKGIDPPPEVPAEASAGSTETAEAVSRASLGNAGDSGGGGGGFVFYTNYESTKGRELDTNPRAAMNFYWDTLARCVRIHGRVTKISAEETAAYFQTRPRGSQLGAWCSHQSSVIPGRDTLTERYEQLEKQYPGDTPIPVPPTWGGYRVTPEVFEFWQGQPSRLHDRFKYQLVDKNVWSIDRLSP